ncbi:hypothetical protein RA2_01585 [Roseovarius sp. A-2]|uniref:hypothetical protein n=1 Tax=Roseovarius sp. A-2 TaxID=1570360 RepID=UPI0009B5887C|nr:hypothetical protein [Roseovarius sp. A-2]GAW34535.1 hypothetical protein RA2_01585 [Roseovarius sp. A-2]
MKRRFLLAAIAAVTVATALPAVAAPKRLSASEIDTLLAGNTISGTWSGTAYHQYFATDGTTLYVPDGGEDDEGKWRVNADTNEYESWWRSTGWTPYAMVRTDEDGYAWVNGDRLEPFTVQEGRQLE